MTHLNEQHRDSVFPHGQVQGSPFHGGPGQHGMGQPLPSQQHSQQHAPAAAYGPGVHHRQPSHAPNPAAQPSAYEQQGPPATPSGAATAATFGHEGPGYPAQAQRYGHQAPLHSMPPSQMQAQTEYGSPAQPDMRSGGQAMGAPGQIGAARSQQGMSHQEMAQQAERKRRFTEQKRETHWQQVYSHL